MKHKALTLALVACAAHLFFIGSATAATQSDIIGPVGSERFGQSVTVLPNGNIVVTDPLFDAPGPVPNVGAVYLYNPNGELISTLTGTAANDRVGDEPPVVLANGNYVVRSTKWISGGAENAGAITWCSGTSGCTGTVSAANSLVGSTKDDDIGSSVNALPNGHYVSRSAKWDDGGTKDVGAVTWCNGTTGCTGAVSSTNSLVGTTADDGVGSTRTRVLTNGNYVTGTLYWDNGSVKDVGAMTWCDGTKGCVGPVSTANSLHGTTANDRVGILSARALANGNYVVRSYVWNNGSVAAAGAATWCDGTKGCVGPVSPANSLVGTTADDQVGNEVTILSNGNYVVQSSHWDNGTAANAGAATWCNGATGCTGAVSPANSLVGSTINDSVSSGQAVALSNGNYVVNSPNWSSGGTVGIGAATWCDGTVGCVGPVSAANSLIGTRANDFVGIFTTALAGGHYVVRSPSWSNGGVDRVGAATWCNGATGRTGVVSSANSLVGSAANDGVGGNVVALANGNYVVASPSWNNGPVSAAGAVTWCNGAGGCTGAVSPANSLVGSTNQDQVGAGGVVPLSDGDYVVGSPGWGASDFGAVTWGSGTAGRTGVVSAANSLVGSTASDVLGFVNAVEALPDGNYLVDTAEWNNGVAVDVGALTLGRGDGSTVGAINAGNSVRGGTSNGGPLLNADYNLATGQMVVGRAADRVVSLFTYRGGGLTVTTTADHDDGTCNAEDCTLREAINAANAVADDSTITFAPGVAGTIQLGGALPSLQSNITLRGPGADLLTVRRNTGGDYRIFTVTNGSVAGPVVEITGLTISNGEAPMDKNNSGGGILNRRGSLTVRDCTLTGNRAFHADKTGFGGAILNSDGNLTIENSTIADNFANNGGGIASLRGETGTSLLTIRNTTISNNTASAGSGGGVYNEADGDARIAEATVINSTITGNSATPNGFFAGSGGAIYNAGAANGSGELFLQDCTITGNNAPNAGGIYNSGVSASADVALQNTIINAGTTGGNFINSNGTIRSLGNNLSNDDAGSGTSGTGPGGFLNAETDRRNTDPLLGSLAANQGPTLTHALLNGSPAIDAGESTGESLDQRGFRLAGRNDIGAFEFGGTIPPAPSPTPNPSPTPQPSATPSPTPAVNRLANISTRLRVESGDNVLIGGFIVTGSSQKRIIIRALGPSLPISEALSNPVLELYDGNGQFIASNDNWQEAPNAQEIIETTIAPPNEFESAIVRDVDLGAYTAVVRDAADGAGVGLVEVYDLGAAQDAKLANISTRGRVLTGDNVMIGGLIVTGVSEQKVIVRAIGPSLPIDGKLEDPLLELFDANGNLLLANNNWKDAQQSEIEATTIPPSNDLESAFVTSLPPAAYTAVVRGVNDSTGVALIEAYALD